jgi:hypothetical protein
MSKFFSVMFIMNLQSIVLFSLILLQKNRNKNENSYRIKEMKRSPDEKHIYRSTRKINQDISTLTEVIVTG